MTPPGLSVEHRKDNENLKSARNDDTLRLEWVTDLRLHTLFWAVAMQSWDAEICAIRARSHTRKNIEVESRTMEAASDAMFEF